MESEGSSKKGCVTPTSEGSSMGMGERSWERDVGVNLRTA